MKSIFMLAVAAVTTIMNSCGDKTTVYRQAASYYDQKNYSQGIIHFQTSISNDFSKALVMLDAHHFVLRFYDRLGRLHEGRDFYRKLSYPGIQQDLKAAAIAKTNQKSSGPSAEYKLYTAFQDYISGLVLMLQQDYSSAVGKFKDASEGLETQLKGYIVDYHTGLAYIRLGEQALQLEHNRDARRYFFYAKAALTRCVKQNSDFHMGFYYLGLLHAYKHHEMRVGKALLEKALNKFPDFEKDAKYDALISLGRINLITGKTNSAVQYFERVAAADFAKLARSVDLGTIYLNLKRRSDATAFWTKAVRVLGHNTARGRFYIFRNAAVSAGYADFSGVAFSFPTVEWGGEMHTVIGDRNKLAFKNPEDRQLYYAMYRGRLIDRRFGFETWIIEKDKFRSERQVIRRWMQDRGIYKELNLSKNSKLYVSVYQREYPVKKPGLFLGKYKTNGNLDDPKYTFWRLTDPRFGYFVNGKAKQFFQHNFVHFVDAKLVDYDGDGRMDLAVAGINAAQELEIVLYRLNSTGDRWEDSGRYKTDLQDNRNGFVLLQLDATPALEMIKFSDPVSWADVYSLKNGKFVLNNKLYPGFARDYASRFGFFTDDYLQRVLSGDGISPGMQLLYRSYARNLKKANAIISGL